MPSNYGLEYMPGGKLYGLNSPFITSNNPPKPSTDNKLGYLGLSGTNSATYTPPPSWVSTVDNPGTFVPSQPLVEQTGTRGQARPDGSYNWLTDAPGNVGANAASLSSNAPGFSVTAGAPGNTTSTTTSTNSSINGSSNPYGIGTTGKKYPAQQSSGMPQPDSNTVTQRGNGGYNYTSVVDALAQQQQPQFSQFSPLKGLFRVGSR